jgi:hypothetical protein
MNTTINLLEFDRGERSAEFVAPDPFVVADVRLALIARRNAPVPYERMFPTRVPVDSLHDDDWLPGDLNPLFDGN